MAPVLLAAGLRGATSIPCDLNDYLSDRRQHRTVAPNELESLDLSAVAIACTGSISCITLQANGRPIGCDERTPSQYD